MRELWTLHNIRITLTKQSMMNDRGISDYFLFLFSYLVFPVLDVLRQGQCHVLLCALLLVFCCWMFHLSSYIDVHDSVLMALNMFKISFFRDNPNKYILLNYLGDSRAKYKYSFL